MFHGIHVVKYSIALNQVQIMYFFDYYLWIDQAVHTALCQDILAPAFKVPIPCWRAGSVMHWTLYEYIFVNGVSIIYSLSYMTQKWKIVCLQIPQKGFMPFITKRALKNIDSIIHGTSNTTKDCSKLRHLTCYLSYSVSWTELFPVIPPLIQKMGEALHLVSSMIQ